VRVVDFNALAAVLTVEKCSGKKLTILFKYAAKNNPAAAESLSNLGYSRARLLIPMRLGRWTRTCFGILLRMLLPCQDL
jgi:hypothetical protein